MSDQIREIFADWSLNLPLTLAMLVTAGLYARGWSVIRKTRPAYFGEWRLVAFLCGMAVLWVAICSPIDGFADVVLSAHMVQHLLIMVLVPPLLLLGAPTVPMLRGLPRRLVSRVGGPLLGSGLVRGMEHTLTSLPFAWMLFNLVFLAWHVPAAYDFALENESWHAFEHICFLTASLIFWWPIIRPWPHRSSAARWNGASWKLLLYLLTADLVNTALSAFLAFCDRPIYAYYLNRTNPFGLKPYDDQVLGAVIMWVIGSIFYLVPAVILAMTMLRRDPQRSASAIY